MLGKRRSRQVGEPAAFADPADQALAVADRRPRFGRHRRLLVAASLTLGTVTAVTFASGSDPVSAAPSNGQTDRASVTNAGAQAQFGGDESQISGNGRFDIFVSRSNLGPEDTGDNAQVYVRDLAAHTTVQVSQQGDFDPAKAALTDGVTPTGQSPSGRAVAPTISADGRYVAFITDANDVVPHTSGDSSFGDTLVVCDRDPDGDGTFAVNNGIPDEKCFHVDDSFGGNLDISNPPRLSPDGTHLVWVNFVVGGGSRIELTRLANNDGTGPLTGHHSVVTVPNNAIPVPNGTHPSYDQPVVANQQPLGVGNHSVRVAFSAFIPNGGNSNGATLAVLATDVTTLDQPAHTTVVIQGAEQFPILQAPTTRNRPRATITHTEYFGDPSISDDGSKIAFDHVQGDAVQFQPLAYVGTFDGTNWGLQIVSEDNARNDADGAFPALSGDGRYVAFVTDSPNMDDGPAFVPTPQVEGQPDDSCARQFFAFAYFNHPDAPCQVVAHDLVADPLSTDGTRVSDCAHPGDNGCDHNDFDKVQGAFENEFNSSGPVSLSSDGGKVAFQSQSDALVPGDTNFAETCSGEGCENYDGTDAFVRTWAPPVDAINLDVGGVHIGNSSEPTSYDVGVAFGEFGPLLVQDVVVKGGGGQFSVDPTGCVGALLHQSESCTVTVQFIPDHTGVSNATIEILTRTGQFSRDLTGTGLPALDVTTNDIVRTSVSSGDPASPKNQAPHGTTDTSQVSGNGDYDVFVSTDPLGQLGSTRGHENVFVRNLRTNTTVQISLEGTVPVGGVDGQPSIPDGGVPDGNSFDPSISADGRLVSFVTEAQNIVPTRLTEGTTDTVVVCDRDPDGDGQFDEPQGDTGIPDYRCFNVENELENNSSAQSPRLSADGMHLVLSHTPDFTEGDNNDEIQLYRLPHGAGAPLQTPVLQAHISPPVGAIDAPKYFQPVVSDQGQFGSATSVRVAFEAEGVIGVDTAATAIGLTTVTAAGQTTTRIDRVPGGAGFVGDQRGRLLNFVGNPSITDAGNKVAFDHANRFSGLAQSLIATVGANGSASTALIAVDKAGTPARAVDPALSGDGRYVAYVTDSPQFSGKNAADPPGSSCLHFQDNTLRPRAVTDSAQCQIVARDLVADAARAQQNLPLAPDALVSESGSQPPCPLPATENGGTCPGDDDSLDPSVDTIGSAVGFDSFADDLVANDTNDFRGEGVNHLSAQDAFVRFFFPTANLGQVNFGNVQVGQPSSRNVPISINGFGPYQIGTPTVGGTNAGDFTVTPGTCQVPGQVLHRGETCSITVTFKPGAAGTRTGTVTVSGKNNPKPTTITVTGFGVKAPPRRADISATPNPVNFGRDIPLHKPGRTRTVAVTNTGGQPLVITNATAIDGSVPHAARDYSVDAGACQPLVAPGATCHISVTWIGTAVGQRPALLRILDNAPGGMSVITLQAAVGKPVLIVNPAVSPAGRVTTVSGTGFAPKRSVTIVFGQGGGTEIATAKTDRHGAFDTGLVVFPKALVGPRIIHASVDHASKSISADVPFLVVLGTLEAPHLVTRH